VIEAIAALAAVLAGLCATACGVTIFRAKNAKPTHQHMWEVVKAEAYGRFPDGVKRERKNATSKFTVVYYRCLAHVPPETKTEQIEGEWTLEELRGELGQ
jgi:hypothetical protein